MPTRQNYYPVKIRLEIVLFAKFLPSYFCRETCQPVLGYFMPKSLEIVVEMRWYFSVLKWIILFEYKPLWC